MEGDTLQAFYTQLVLMPKVLHYAQYVLLALGGVLLLVLLIYQIRSQVSGGRSVALGRVAHCLPAGGERGLGGVARSSLPGVRADARSLEPALGSVRVSAGPGELSLGPCSSCACMATSLPVLGGLGTLPQRGCWWASGDETRSGLFTGAGLCRGQGPSGRGQGLRWGQGRPGKYTKKSVTDETDDRKREGLSNGSKPEPRA